MMGSLTGGPRANTVKTRNSQDLVPVPVILGQRNAADPVSAAWITAHWAILEDNSWRPSACRTGQPGCACR